MISYELALAYECKYCVVHYGEILRMMGMSEEKIRDLERDIKKTNLDEKTKRILIFSRHASEKVM
ncbi:MAG: hypothetical protein QXX95_04830 [Nitrososphaerales archaeon]